MYPNPYAQQYWQQPYVGFGYQPQPQQGWSYSPMYVGDAPLYYGANDAQFLGAPAAVASTQKVDWAGVLVGAAIGLVVGIVFGRVV